MCCLMPWKYNPTLWCWFSSTCINFLRFKMDARHQLVISQMWYAAHSTFVQLKHTFPEIWNILQPKCVWKTSLSAYATLQRARVEKEILLGGRHTQRRTYERILLENAILTLPNSWFMLLTKSRCEYCTTESKQPEKCCSWPAEGHLLNGEWISNPV